MTTKTQPTVRLLVIATAVLLSACASVVSVVYPLNENAAKARAGAYTLDPDHASVLFAVSHFGFSTFRGRFSVLSGSLDLDSENPENSSVTIEIKTASIDTGVGELDELLLENDMLAAADNPVIAFTSTSITRTSEDRATIEGVLTMAGVTNPVILQSQFICSGTNPLTRKKTTGFSATATLLRSEFNLKEWLPFVGDEVEITIDVEFTKER